MNPFDHVMKIPQQQPAPPPAPPQTAKKVTAKEYGGVNWLYTVPTSPAGGIEPARDHNALVVIGQLARVADLLHAIATSLYAVESRLDLIDRNTRKRPAAASPTKADRERASRERALSAYLKAGGGGRVLGMPVADLRLSVRARKVMKRLNLATVGAILDFGLINLLSQKNFGVTTLTEVRAKLEEVGVQFRDGEPS